jgi:hopene-associated glycosyltransferase HpnB
MIWGWIFGGVPLLIWLYLLLGRDFFWLARERDDRNEFYVELESWPSVVAVVPARNEADVLDRSLGGLLQQNYPGRFSIVLVDDQSTDRTANVARAFGRTERLEVVGGTPRPIGWMGKPWAMSQGVAQAMADMPPDFFWFTDADIAHVPDSLRHLVVRAEKNGLVLASLMAKLSCKTVVEHALIPAFVFFFAMLFPFARVNNPKRKLAAAAGGCMLVRRTALEAAGGIASIRQEIIDDCALARQLKPQGRVWLGLTNRSQSVRPYETLLEIRQMVARSAYAQLGYSRLILAGTIIGMVTVYAAAPFVALLGWNSAQIAGWVTWALMALAFQPLLRFYRLSPLWGFALPVIGAVYAFFTLDSAFQFWRGRGGMWKGRAQAVGST